MATLGAHPEEDARCINYIPISDASDSASVHEHQPEHIDDQHSGASYRAPVPIGEENKIEGTPQQTSEDAPPIDGSQAVRAEAANRSGVKRAPEYELEGQNVKKAKTGEQCGSVNDIVEVPNPHKDETYDELKQRANQTLMQKMAVIRELREDLKLLEEERDRERIERIALDNKLGAVHANEKAQEAKYKAERKATYARYKTEIREEYDSNLKAKTTKIEARLTKQLTTTKKTSQAEIDELRVKNKGMVEEVKDLKANHKDEVRRLRYDLKEAEKEGGPKAREDLKRMRLEMKDKDQELKEMKDDRVNLERQIGNLKSAANAAKTGEEQSQTALDNTFHEVRDLREQLASWKAICIEIKKDGPIREQHWEAEMKKTNDKWQRQVNLLNERAAAGVTYQRSCKALQRQNERNNQQRFADQEKIAELENKLVLASKEGKCAEKTVECLEWERTKFQDEDLRTRQALGGAKTSSEADFSRPSPAKAHVPTVGRASTENEKHASGDECDRIDREDSANQDAATMASNEWSSPKDV